MRPGPLTALLLVHAALVLGGVYFMLTKFGDELERKLDDRVDTVQADFQRDLDSVRRSVVREIDARLARQP